MDRLGRIFWLGTKELRSLQRDRVIIGLLVFAFTFSVYVRAKGISTDVHNASIAIVDEDRSTLSSRIANAFHAPYFHEPRAIQAHEVDRRMDANEFIFVLDIPPHFEADVLAGDSTAIQLNIDATAMTQARIGASYIDAIVRGEIERFVRGFHGEREPRVRLVSRMAFNPNRTSAWFNAIVTIVDQISMLTIVLTGAALIREREHGTIEHLMVMPLSALDIALSKVWANALVILVSVAASLFFVVELLVGVPIAGSRLLFLAGVSLYLFFATALGIFLATITRSMARFALLMLLVLLPLNMLSGARTPVESQPDWLQALTVLLPSRHFVNFSQGIIFRGAGIEIVWPDFLTVTLLGLAFFLASLALFRRSLSETS